MHGPQTFVCCHLPEAQQGTETKTTSSMALLENKKYHRGAELVLGGFYQKRADKPRFTVAQKLRKFVNYLIIHYLELLESNVRLYK